MYATHYTPVNRVCKSSVQIKNYAEVQQEKQTPDCSQNGPRRIEFDVLWHGEYGSFE